MPQQVPSIEFEFRGLPLRALGVEYIPAKTFMGKPGFDSATWDILVIRTDKGLNDITKILKASTQDEIVDVICNMMREQDGT